jgi:hypothetical protein
VTAFSAFSAVNRFFVAASGWAAILSGDRLQLPPESMSGNYS